MTDRDDTPSGGAGADDGYGYSGRGGFQEGNYSGAYGRGSAGEHDTPSASGYAGAGYTRGGTDLPSPDVVAGQPVRADEEDGGAGDPLNEPLDEHLDEDAAGGTGRTGR